MAVQRVEDVGAPAISRHRDQIGGFPETGIILVGIGIDQQGPQRRRQFGLRGGTEQETRQGKTKNNKAHRGLLAARVTPRPGASRRVGPR